MRILFLAHSFAEDILSIMFSLGSQDVSSVVTPGYLLTCDDLELGDSIREEKREFAF